MIDPIDGTRSFILGQMHWATLIALHDGDGVVVGVAHQPFVGESFLATAGGAAEWRRGGERRTLADASLPDVSRTRSSPAPTRKMFRTAGERAAFDASPTARA